MAFITGDNTDPVFTQLIVRLADAFGVTLTEHRIRTYARALSDLSLDQVRAACARAVREQRFFPAVATLRQCAGDRGEDAGVLAWAVLRKAASDVGAYTTLVVADGAAAAALEAVFGSWPEFCAMEEGPALHARRQEFLAAYRAAHLASLAPRKLSGLCEREGGYDATKSVAALLGPAGDVEFGLESGFRARKVLTE